MTKKIKFKIQESSKVAQGISKHKKNSYEKQDIKDENNDF